MKPSKDSFAKNSQRRKLRFYPEFSEQHLPEQNDGQVAERSEALGEAAIHPREIVRAAIAQSATALILVHNHPSGRTEPGAEDRAITEKFYIATIH